MHYKHHTIDSRTLDLEGSAQIKQSSLACSNTNYQVIAIVGKKYINRAARKIIRRKRNYRRVTLCSFRWWCQLNGECLRFVVPSLTWAHSSLRLQREQHCCCDCRIDRIFDIRIPMYECWYLVVRAPKQRYSRTLTPYVLPSSSGAVAHMKN